MTTCEQCDWSSHVLSQKDEHMLTHTSQYSCDICKQVFKNYNEMKVHKETHIVKKLTCITCDKLFLTDHSFKQHMTAKHKNSQAKSPLTNDSFPVGHPERYQQKQEQRKCIACTICNKLFANGGEIEDHMEEHVQQNGKFECPTKEKICKYFRNGYCAKGEQCAFKHCKNNIKACRYGQQCTFLYQNRCKFYHEEIGVQDFRVRWRQHGKQKECKFQERCWNPKECNYVHKEQDFQMANRSNRPPQDPWWINY